MFHPKHHLSPNTLASLATGSSRLRAYGRLQPAEWPCTQAIGSEQGSRIGEVYLHRTRPHQPSPLVHTALSPKFLWLAERGVSQFPVQAFHSDYSMWGGGWGGAKNALQWSERDLSPLRDTERDGDRESKTDTWSQIHTEIKTQIS